MKLIKAATLILFSLCFSLAIAGEIKPYNQAQFDALNASGKPVLISVHADWCPTCRAQKPIIEELMKQAAYSNVTTLVVNFDGDQALLKKFRVTKQSTLIAFKAGKEVDRSIGDTSAAGIENLIKKSVN